MVVSVDGSDFRVPLDTYFLPQAALLISSKLLSGHSFPSSSSAIKLGGKISDASKPAVIDEKLLRLQVNIAVSTRNAFS